MQNDTGGFDGQTRCDRCGMMYRGMTCDLCERISLKDERIPCPKCGDPVTTADPGEIAAAALAMELPECVRCDGAGKTRVNHGRIDELDISCRNCDGTGRKGGSVAQCGLDGLKAELEQARKDLGSGWPITHETDSPETAATVDFIRSQVKHTHAAAIERISGYIAEMTGGQE